MKVLRAGCNSCDELPWNYLICVIRIERCILQDNKVEKDIHVDPRYHAHFVARRGEILRQIANECGGVTVSFPRASTKSDKVVLKGSKDCIDEAVKRIEDIVSDLVNVATVRCRVVEMLNEPLCKPLIHR
jgi:hypothetical protein